MLCGPGSRESTSHPLTPPQRVFLVPLVACMRVIWQHPPPGIVVRVGGLCSSGYILATAVQYSFMWWPFSSQHALNQTTGGKQPNPPKREGDKEEGWRHPAKEAERERETHIHTLVSRQGTQLLVVAVLCVVVVVGRGWRTDLRCRDSGCTVRHVTHSMWGRNRWRSGCGMGTVSTLTPRRMSCSTTRNGCRRPCRWVARPNRWPCSPGRWSVRSCSHLTPPCVHRHGLRNDILLVVLCCGCCCLLLLLLFRAVGLVLVRGVS